MRPRSSSRGRNKSASVTVTDSQLNKFICAANRCSPVPVVQHAVADSYLAVQGSVVQYTCIDGFSTSSHMSTACDGINWMPAQLPGCEGTTRFVIS